jgi:hypothetical protein
MSHFRRTTTPYAVVTAGGATTGAAATAGAFFAAAAFLATALPFVFVAFLAADFNFRPRIAFFCIELLFLAMVIPPRAREHLGPGPYYAHCPYIASHLKLPRGPCRARGPCTPNARQGVAHRQSWVYVITRAGSQNAIPANYSRSIR